MHAWPTPLKARVPPVNGSGAAADATPAGLFTDATAASRLSAWLNSQSAARSRLPWQACRRVVMSHGGRWGHVRHPAQTVHTLFVDVTSASSMQTTQDGPLSCRLAPKHPCPNHRMPTAHTLRGGCGGAPADSPIGMPVETPCLGMSADSCSLYFFVLAAAPAARQATQAVPPWLSFPSL